MFTTSAFSHLVDGLRAVHRSRTNDALIRSLPRDVRRDIGWPDRLSTGEDRATPFWTGRWFR